MPQQGTAYAIPNYGARPSGEFPTGRGPVRQRPTRDHPARPIADIFDLTGNIGGWGRGQERVGGGEWPQGLREVGRGGEGGKAESEGWSGGSNATSDIESEEEGWGHVPLTELS